jgi:cytochrome c oxidase cbb3-type subunit 1
VVRCGATQAGVFKNKEVIQMQSQATYNYKVVRQFAIMTVVWGIVGMLVGVIAAAQPSAAHQRGDLRVRWLRAVRDVVLRGAAYLSHAAVRARLAAFTFWGWQAGHRAGGDHLPLGYTRARNTPSSSGRSTS